MMVNTKFRVKKMSLLYTIFTSQYNNILYFVDIQILKKLLCEIIKKNSTCTLILKENLH